MKRLAAYISALVLAGCGYNDFDTVPAPYTYPQVANITIGELKELYPGDSPVLVNGDVVVSGFVTTSDREQNFYRTFFIEQNGHGLEIKAGLYDLHRAYHTGERVVVRLSGLILSRNYGAMQVGVKPPRYSYYDSDYFASRARLGEYVFRDDRYENVIPQAKEIPALDMSLCGSLVRIGGLRYKPGIPDTWADVSSRYETYRIFEDAQGDNVAVYVSKYASFAGGNIPSGEDISITGILLYGKTTGGEATKMYILKPSDVEE